MHLVAGEGRTIGGLTLDLLEPLLSGKSRLDIEQAETFDQAGLTFDTLGIVDRSPEHLIAAAEPEHAAAAAEMRHEIDVEARIAERREVGDGGLGPREDDKRGIARQR